MSTKELESKIKELRELKRLREELETEMTAIEDELKSYMDATNTDEISTNEYKITWKPVTSSRLDTAAIRKSMPELAKLYTKTTTARRFVVQ